MGRKKATPAKDRPAWWTDEMRNGYIAWLSQVLSDLEYARRNLRSVSDPESAIPLQAQLLYWQHQISTIKWLIAIARQSLTSRPPTLEEAPVEPG